MKLVQKVLLATLFVSVLSVSAFGGDLETPGLASPPPSHSMSTSASTTDEAPSAIAESVDEPSDELLYDALMLVLSLF